MPLVFFPDPPQEQMNHPQQVREVLEFHERHFGGGAAVGGIGNSRKQELYADAASIGTTTTTTTSTTLPKSAPTSPRIEHPEADSAGGKKNENESENESESESDAGGLGSSQSQIVRPTWAPPNAFERRVTVSHQHKRHRRSRSATSGFHRFRNEVAANTRPESKDRTSTSPGDLQAGTRRVLRVVLCRVCRVVLRVVRVCRVCRVCRVACCVCCVRS